MERAHFLLRADNSCRTPRWAGRAGQPEGQLEVTGATDVIPLEPGRRAHTTFCPLDKHGPSFVQGAARKRSLHFKGWAGKAQGEHQEPHIQFRVLCLRTAGSSKFQKHISILPLNACIFIDTYVFIHIYAHTSFESFFRKRDITSKKKKKLLPAMPAFHMGTGYGH